MRTKIIHTATDLFLKLGVRSITMNDIANELGISKKTIYEHFDNKTELIKECTFSFAESITEDINEICALNKNPIEEMFEIKKLVLSKLKRVQFSPQFQLQKYYPQIDKAVRKLQFEQITLCTINNLKRGISDGFYRKDINPDLIARFYFNGITGIRNKDIFPQQDFPPSYISNEFLEFYLRGIVTSKGLSLLNNFIKEKTQDE